MRRPHKLYRYWRAARLVSRHPRGTRVSQYESSFFARAPNALMHHGTCSAYTVFYECTYPVPTFVGAGCLRDEY